MVEGYTDVLAPHQAGFREAVAVMGTAITPEQVQLLAAHAEEVVLALDADRGGARGDAARAAGGVGQARAAAGRGDDGGEDPADTLAGKGPGSDAADAFRALVDDADDLPVFHVRMLLDGCGPGDARRSRPGARRARAGAERDAGFDHARGAGA